MILATTLALVLQFSQGGALASSSPPATQDALPRRGALGIAFTPLNEELLKKHNLQPGTGGLLAQAPLPGFTAAKAGIQAGDIILKVNGKVVGAPTIGAVARELPAGQLVTFGILRDGKPLDLKADMVEKPRDPGGPNYSVTYSHITSHDKRMRTIITNPKKPGKFPALFFIQGLSPISYDFPLETATGDVTSLDGPILFDFANNGFVTIRVEKPGVGDSEGGPYPTMDYTTELDIYRQTLKQLKSLPSVDTGNIFIFGHSMGGAFGPMVAVESPVKGLAIYGAASRTWFEYIMDVVRYQQIVGGNTYEAVDEIARQGAQIMAQVFLENKSTEEVKKSHPKLAGMIDSYFPGGSFNGKSLDFWRELAQTNFASYWAKVNAHVLSVKGESDFVVYEADHKLIADIVNRAKPGFGKFAICPSSDHLFHNFPTEEASNKNFSKGKYNPAFSQMMMAWVREVMAKG